MMSVLTYCNLCGELMPTDGWGCRACHPLAKKVKELEDRLLEVCAAAGVPTPTTPLIPYLDQQRQRVAELDARIPSLSPLRGRHHA